MCNDQAIHGGKHFTFSPLPTVHPRSDYHPHSPSFPKGEEMAVTGWQLSIGRGPRAETDDAIGRGWSRKFGELLWSLRGRVMDLMWLEGMRRLANILGGDDKKTLHYPHRTLPPPSLPAFCTTLCSPHFMLLPLSLLVLKEEKIDRV